MKKGTLTFLFISLANMLQSLLNLVGCRPDKYSTRQRKNSPPRMCYCRSGEDSLERCWDADND